MSDTLLLVVFATHAPFFALRWVRTREPRFAATTVTFALLVATYGVKIAAPDLRIGELPVFHALRVAAWAAATVSLGMLLRHWVLRKRRSHA
ncbi:MAG: hypothetical protein AAF430_04235 [Myxococcota bacterium]